MKINKYFLTVIIATMFFTLSLAAQSNNDWRTYLSYHNATGVAETNTQVYVLANGSLYSYGKSDEKITLHSKQSGLNDTDVSIIKYDPGTHTLIIVYSNGNIDLYDNDGIKNMPYLKNATGIQSKKVNNIYFRNHFAYFSTDFGIMVVNLERKEVSDTYNLNRKVNAVCVKGDSIYASTDKGLLKAGTRENLLDASVWQEKKLNTTVFKEDEIINMCIFKNNLVFFVERNGIYNETPDGEINVMLKQSHTSNMTLQNDELLVYTSDNMYIFSDIDNHSYVNVGVINDAASLKIDNKYWIASGTNGLVGIQRGSDNRFVRIVSELETNSPKRNFNTFMTIFNDNKLLVTGGGRTTARLERPGTLMVYEDDNWYNFNESTANNEIQKLIGSGSRDYMGVAVNPNDENHYFIATYGEGIIELKNNEFVNLYNSNNSPLKSTGNGNATNDVRIGSVCFDKEGNLWSTNCLVSNAINVMKPNGEWKSLYYPQLNNADKLDKIMITSRGHKWVNIPFDNAGIAVIDDRGTIDDTSDDICNFFSSFRDAQSPTRAPLSASEYLCMAEDQNGTIWIGTNIGLLKCSSPSLAISNPSELSCSRLVRDGDAYFLSGESVTAIAVDADKQKWIGTSSQGVFLINEDGSETIYSFNTGNSPLLSNTINSIAINNKTGEVFFGTEKGIISFNSGIKSESTPFSDVYATPNPVRPNHIDKVTIMGLTNNANVKITDINGNIIYQGRAIGNRMEWNCRNINGNRVATGVYLVMASTTDATESVVTKIAVVN